MILEKVYDELIGMIEDLKKKVAGISGGSTVTITPTLESGVKLADYSIDGTDGEIYAPDIADRISNLYISYHTVSVEFNNTTTAQIALDGILPAGHQFVSASVIGKAIVLWSALNSLMTHISIATSAAVTGTYEVRVILFSTPITRKTTTKKK